MHQVICMCACTAVIRVLRMKRHIFWWFILMWMWCLTLSESSQPMCSVGLSRWDHNPRMSLHVSVPCHEFVGLLIHLKSLCQCHACAPSLRIWPQLAPVMPSFGASVDQLMLSAVQFWSMAMAEDTSQLVLFAVECDFVFQMLGPSLSVGMRRPM